MSGLASNLCLLGIMYVISVAVYLFRNWCIRVQEEEERRYHRW